MKKALLFLALVVTVFASCSKSDTIITAPHVPPYHVEGIKDVTLQKYNNGNSNTYMMLSFVYENQEQEKISLSLEGTPQGLRTEFSDSTGYPSFTTSLSIIDSNVAPGNYPVKLVATGAVSGRKEFSFNVKVLAAPVVNAIIAGNGFNSYTTCGTGSFTQNVTPVAGSNSRILFSDFDNSGNQVVGILDGIDSNGYITIPTQTVNGVTYSNASSSVGYYNVSSTGSKYISVSFIRSTAGGGNNYCSLYMNL